MRKSTGVISKPGGLAKAKAPPKERAEGRSGWLEVKTSRSISYTAVGGMPPPQRGAVPTRPAKTTHFQASKRKPAHPRGGQNSPPKDGGHARTQSARVGTRKMVIYAWPGRSRGKPGGGPKRF